MTATFEKQHQKNLTPLPIDGRESLHRAIEKLRDNETVVVVPAIPCYWTGRTYRLTYLKLDRVVFGWIEEPGTPPFEQYREVTGGIYLPVRQWVAFDRLVLATLAYERSSILFFWWMRIHQW